MKFTDAGYGETHQKDPGTALKFLVSTDAFIRIKCSNNKLLKYRKRNWEKLAVLDITKLCQKFSFIVLRGKEYTQLKRVQSM